MGSFLFSNKAAAQPDLRHPDHRDGGAVRGVGVRGALAGELSVCTNGPVELPDGQLDSVGGSGVSVIDTPLAEIVEAGEGVELHFTDGGSPRRDAVFVDHVSRDRELDERLELDRTGDGLIETDETGQTSTPGLYAAGDLCTRPGCHSRFRPGRLRAARPAWRWPTKT